MFSDGSKGEEEVEMPGDKPPAVCTVYLSTLGGSWRHLCFIGEAPQTQSSCPAREQNSAFALWPDLSPLCFPGTRLSRIDSLKKQTLWGTVVHAFSPRD